MTTPMPEGGGLFEITRPGGPGLPDGMPQRHITNVRRLAGTERAPGSLLIGAGTILLGLLDAGLLFVSFRAQYDYIFKEKNDTAPSYIEAGMLDLGMIIFSVLALGLARQGKPSRTERALIMACSALSALMNYAASNTTSLRSVAAYTAAPVFFAVVTDRVVAVVRRHVLGISEDSAWKTLGQAVAATARVTGRAAAAVACFTGLVLLYLLRFAVAAPSTARGLRQMVLDAAPVPGLITAELVTADHDTQPEQPAVEDGQARQAQLLAAYRAHPEYGVRSAAGRIAFELGKQAGIHAGDAMFLIEGEIGRLDDTGHAGEEAPVS